jgi:sec-independent protein translocase protein TatA
MPNIGPLELIIILAIVVVLFGATRIGDIGKGLGRGIKEFRRELKDEDAEKKPVDSATVASKTTDDKPAQTH